VVAESANRLCIPWLLCFRPSNLPAGYEADADVEHLVGNVNLQRQLDELARSRLQPWCSRHGFGWGGFAVSSPDWARE